MTISATDFAGWRRTLIALVESEARQNSHVDGAHDLPHLHRVWRNAEALMTDELHGDTGETTHNDDLRLVVLAACYLHDLVNLPKNHPQRSQASHVSARRAALLLGEAGFPPALLDAVRHAIEAHSFSACIAPCSVAARIVQDADRLDALGAVGLARLFYIAGQMGSALSDGADPLATTRVPDDRRFALDHIVVKLAQLPAAMQTASGRALGEQRLQILLDFRRQFAAEWSGAPATGEARP